jgi:hypothetical protein
MYCKYVHRQLSPGSIKIEYEMGGACSAHVSDEKCTKRERDRKDSKRVEAKRKWGEK